MQIVKVPGLNGLGKTRGCRNAGNAILAELKNIYSSEKGKIIDVDLLDLEEIHVNNADLDEQEELINEDSFEIMGNQDKVIFLGGDHSISFSTCRAFLHHCKDHEEPACIIVFDAHPDCMKPGKNPTHEEWLRALIEKKVGSNIPAENILLVGARNSYKDEIEFLAKNKIKQIGMNQLNNNLEETTDIIMEFASGKKLYVSFDIDVVDPAFAPGTGYAEPGGLTGRQAIYILQRISLMKNLKAIDIVEINSEKDEKNLTIKLGAKLLAELL